MNENEQNVVQNITSQQNNQLVQDENTNIETKNIPNQLDTPITHEGIDNSNQKGSKLKTFGLIFLFLLLFLLVMFLPQISSFIDSRKHQEQVVVTKPKEEVYKTRVCELLKTTDNMTNTVKLEFQYQNNALKKEKLTNTIVLQNVNDEVDQLRTMYLSCQSFQKQIEKNPGVKQTCSLKDNIYQIIQNIDYTKLSDLSIQENIGELEGFYPEFSLNQDRTVIEKELTQSGYVCENKN